MRDRSSPRDLGADSLMPSRTRTLRAAVAKTDATPDLGGQVRVPRQRTATAAVRSGPGPIRTGAFLLAAQFPGQGHAEALDRAVSAAVAAEHAGLDSVWLAEHHFVP